MTILLWPMSFCFFFFFFLFSFFAVVAFQGCHACVFSPLRYRAAEANCLQSVPESFSQLKSLLQLDLSANSRLGKQAEPLEQLSFKDSLRFAPEAYLRWAMKLVFFFAGTEHQDHLNLA